MELNSKNLINEFDKKLEEIFVKINKNKFPKKIAVAVSGGSDSMALTFLLEKFSTKKNIQLFAITIDHKIRKESSIEAKNINKIFKKYQIFHQIISIKKNQVPTRNIEANLREIRYKMLEEFCCKNKINFLFLGHHIGDVAENFLIRLFRGSGLDGLSTMLEINQHEKIYLIRPLLKQNKEVLQKFLIQEKIKWFEDESNSDEKFLRNKIRNFLNTFSEKNLIEERIKKSCDEISKVRDLFDIEMLKQAKKFLFIDKKLGFLIDVKKFTKIEERFALKILALILIELSNKPYKPRLIKLQNFYNQIIKITNDDIKNLVKKKSCNVGLYGCIAKKIDSDRILITKEFFREKSNTIIIDKLKTKLNIIFNKCP